MALRLMPEDSTAKFIAQKRMAASSTNSAASEARAVSLSLHSKILKIIKIIVIIIIITVTVTITITVTIRKQ